MRIIKIHLNQLHNGGNQDGEAIIQLRTTRIMDGIIKLIIGMKMQKNLLINTLS